MHFLFKRTVSLLRQADGACGRLGPGSGLQNGHVTQAKALKLNTRARSVITPASLNVACPGRVALNPLSNAIGAGLSIRVASTAASICATTASSDEKAAHVRVEFQVTGGAGVTGEYPFVWLRDNCQCASCFHPVSKARLMLMRHLDPDIVPRSVHIGRDRDEIVITWPDSHVSPFPITWLWERRFNEETEAKRDRFRQRALQLWGAELQHEIPKGDFNTILNDNRALYNWISTLERIGLFLIQGAPAEPGQIRRLGSRVSFLRRTCYGAVHDVSSKSDPSNLAYTSGTLGLHTDLTQYDYAPGVQMLHCVVQTPTEGGDNVFADGFHVARQIRTNNPEAFRFLSTIPIDSVDMGTDDHDFHLLTKKPVISLDSNGEITRINYNNPIRDTFLTVPLHAVKPLYAAMRMFDDLLHDDSNMISHKLKPGEIVCLHNYRVLHGRLAYEPVVGADRHLQGGHVDWDEITSRRRVLEEKHMPSNI